MVEKIPFILAHRSEPTVTERRAKMRFPVVAAARYRLLDRKSEAIAGTGLTVNVSSSGMLIRIEHMVSVGERIGIEMELLRLGNGSAVGVELATLGHVVRLEPSSAAIHFERYELRRW